MKKQNQKFAFSLIELSIVILVVGVLVVGVSKGSKIISESKLKMAQSLTVNSPTSSIDGLILWYESTLDKSFSDGEAIDTDFGDTGTLSMWNNINPKNENTNNAVQSISDDKPRYMRNSINGLPAVNLDGISEHLTFNGDGLVGTDYTIFFVDQRRDGSNNLVLGGLNPTLNKNLSLGSSSIDGVDFYITNKRTGTFLGVAIPAYSSPIPKISTYRASSTIAGPPLTVNGRNYSLNGVPQVLTHPPGTGSLASPENMAADLLSYDGSAIGRFLLQYCNCDVGEIIIFSKYLTETEKANVEKYLKNKWGIK